jgi:uncharacterized protein YutE (UPF0331/DUF86 family)
MGEVDRTLVLKYLEALNHYIERLTAFQKHSFDEFQSDEAIHWAVEHGLQLAIQCIIDVGNHILASKHLARVEDYRHTILALGEHGIVPKEFAEQLSKMAGFRNILVHMYLGVDLRVVYNILQNHLPAFSEFANHIADYLERK